MISEEARFRREQQAEESLRFNFEQTRTRKLRALKLIARNFPDIRVEQLETLDMLNSLAENLLVSPEKINSITDFSPSYGSEFEANIIVNKLPFDDYLSIQTQQLESVMDQEVEDFARAEDLRRPGFMPTDFERITGWTTYEVLQSKEIAEIITAENLEVQVTELSFNEVEQFATENSELFPADTMQALRIYRYVVLRNLTKIVTDSLRQMLEELLLVAGTAKFSDIALTLGIQLNLDNRKSLETSVDAERRVLDIVGRTAVKFRAIFPQLR